MTYSIKELIIPGKSAGNIKIGWTYEKLVLCSNMLFDKSNPYMPEDVLHDINGDITIYLLETKIIQEICVKNGYKGKVNGIFGIGDCLSEFTDKIEFETNFADSEGFFYFPQIPGLRVLTADWNIKGTSPITLISVFDVVKGTLH